MGIGQAVRVAINGKIEQIIKLGDDSYIPYISNDVPEGISANTLKEMDKAIENFKMGQISPGIDLSDF